MVKSETSKTDVIILAAGSGTRFGAAKQFVLLNGKPLYRHSLDTFAGHPQIRHVVLVLSVGDFERISQEVSEALAGEKIEIVIGGAARQDSLASGMQRLEELGDPGMVLVHDAARPYVTPEIISNIIGGIEEFGAALSAIPLVDSLKLSNDDFAVGTVPRTNLWRAQTPQGARFGILRKALTAAYENDHLATDESELLERIGIKPRLVLGDPRNIKITYEKDLMNDGDRL